MASTGHGRRRGRRAVLITLALAAGPVGLAVGLGGSYARFMADHCRRQLATVPDDRADALMEQAVRLGKPGVAVLVEALASPRSGVARAARRALFDEVDRWRSLAASERSPLAATLAEALAARAVQHPNDATGRDDAARLAAQILLWPLDDSQVDRARVVGCCEKVLRATAAATGNDPIHQSVRSDPIHRVLQEPTPPRPHEPGHNEQPDGESRTADARDVEPPTLDGPLLEQPLGLLAESEDAKPILSAKRPPRQAGSSRPQSQSDSDRLRPLIHLQAAMGVGRESAAAKSGTRTAEKAETFDLVEQLTSRKAGVAAAARRELKRRGFTPLHFEIARQICDPDPAVRVRLARRLPELTSVDALPWLFRLSEDRDARVRMAAIAILATTGDPAVLSRIERMARDDPDPAVARQADEIAQRRKAALR